MLTFFPIKNYIAQIHIKSPPNEIVEIGLLFLQMERTPPTHVFATYVDLIYLGHSKKA